ncbi:Hypothetical protein POVN_LOCUS337 [uncultured virus]|nr:Hypothetical protein POVN_LOCUS337 [uncultured virus]
MGACESAQVAPAPATEEPDVEPMVFDEKLGLKLFEDVQTAKESKENQEAVKLFARKLAQIIVDLRRFRKYTMATDVVFRLADRKDGTKLPGKLKASVRTEAGDSCVDLKLDLIFVRQNHVAIKTLLKDGFGISFNFYKQKTDQAFCIYCEWVYTVPTEAKKA